jgi:hypothetical protein
MNKRQLTMKYAIFEKLEFMAKTTFVKDKKKEYKSLAFNLLECVFSTT